MDSPLYAGSGPSFPVKLDANGSPIMDSGEELVTSSIRMILAYPRNERIFLSKFGAGLEDLMEEPNDQLLKGLVEHFIDEGLNTYEKRIKVIDINVFRTDPDKLKVSLEYELSNRNISQVFTFPFYPIQTTVLIN